MRRWVIMTGKGDAYITSAISASAAVAHFNVCWPGLEVASVFEVTE
jgi:hypothetical protein